MSLMSQDGYIWEPSLDISSGIPTEAVISPSCSIASYNGTTYDVIVVGAGYAGLAAVRDLSDLGHKVLLLESRDRIGGRTYTANIDGHLYEMGGTWVTHHMGYLFREMVRYGMDRDLIETGNPNTHKEGYYTLNVSGALPRTLSHEEARALQVKAWDTFVNVDGQFGRKICPLPHAMLDNAIVDRATVEEWDQLSCHDRYEQIKDTLTKEEQGLLISLLLHISGGNMKNSGLWDMIRSHALLMHSSDNFGDVWLRYKLRQGQTELARRIFKDAVQSGLQYSFLTPVKSIAQGFLKDQPITVTTVDDKIYRARKVITTIPLNVLKNITFCPPLSSRRQEAVDIGHVNHMTKIHAEVTNPELERWNGCHYPGLLMYGYSDGVLPNGNIHLTAFGADERPHFIPERTPTKMIEAFNKLHSMNIKKLAFHNWSTDPWSQGRPAWWQPGYMSKYQDELQSRDGNVFFASADWAHGWRAAIDGALEQGILNSQTVHSELKLARPRCNL